MKSFSSLKMKVICLFSMLFVQFLVQAQYKNREEALKKLFPDSDVISLTNSEKIDIDIVNGKLRISTDNNQENIFLSSKTNAFGGMERSIAYSPFFTEIENIEAATFVPNGNRYDKIEVRDFKTEKGGSNSVFYDDVLEKKFSYSGMKKGAITSLKYREISKNEFMLSGFLFGNYLPTEKAEYKISFPENVKVSFKTYGNMEGIAFKSEVRDGKTVLSWSAQNLKAFPMEPNSPSLRYNIPQVLPYIESYTIDGKKTEVLGSEARLFKYYKSLITGLNSKPDSKLIALTDSLTKGKSEIDKIKSVYYWVQDNVKYVAFEDGMGGFVPREAKDVCTKRFGDCKDMASLITAMLGIAKVKSNLVWIGTRDIPFKYSENSTLSVDNHMIAAVKQNDKYVFLDATDDNIDFGLPTTHIQGKEGMVMLENGDFTIVEVPVIEPELNFRKDEAVFRIENNVLVGSSKTTFEGSWKGDMKHKFGSFSEQQKKEFFDNYFRLGNNKAVVSKTELISLKKRDLPLEMKYNLAIPDYLKTIDDEMYLNPHLFRHFTPNSIIDIEKRKNDIVSDFKWIENSKLLIEIPKGYKVLELPKEKKYSNPKFSFTLNYKQSEKGIEVSQFTKMNTIQVKKEDFAAFNEMVKNLMSAYTDLISFKKI